MGRLLAAVGVLLLSSSARASSAGPCLAELAKDSCTPAEGAEKCGSCAEHHIAGLLKAGCNTSFVTHYCENKLPPSPPPAGGCLAELAKDGCKQGQPEACGKCAHAHEAGLLKAGCTVPFVTSWCEAKPKPPGPGPGPAPAPAPTPTNTSIVNVLVFGDSWGSYGPSFHELEDMFSRHGVKAVVRSAAIGGTQACGWDEGKDIGKEGVGSSLADAAMRLFPELPDGPDHVWYTLGGNDFADKSYQECSRSAKSMAQQQLCTVKLTAGVRNCTESLLEYYWKQYPRSRVMQCGYDLPCEKGPGKCASDHRVPFCRENSTCLDVQSLEWQEIYIGALQARYEELQKNYTGLNIQGTIQASVGVAGAKVGTPVVGVGGSPCDLMCGCVHPCYGKSGATAVGEAFWDLYFKNYPK